MTDFLESEETVLATPNDCPVKRGTGKPVQGHKAVNTRSYLR